MAVSYIIPNGTQTWIVVSCRCCGFLIWSGKMETAYDVLRFGSLIGCGTEIDVNNGAFTVQLYDYADYRVNC
jgi:hypothetical protein